MFEYSLDSWRHRFESAETVHDIEMNHGTSWLNS